MKKYEAVELLEFEDDDAPEVFTEVERPDGPFADFRWKVGRIINHKYIQAFLMICIILNCFTFGLSASDFGKKTEGDDKTAVDTIDTIFLVIFTIEAVMQLIYLGPTIRHHKWICFDLFIVVASWITENMSVFKSLKVRAFRALRSLRLLHIGTMHDLINALTTVAPELGIIFFLSLLMLYIFAVLFTQLFKDFNCSEDRFDRLDKTLFTLLQMMTMDFADPMRNCMLESSWAWIPFVGFILVMGFGMFNLVVAVVCEAMVEINPHENDKQKISRIEQQLQIKMYRASRRLSNAIEQQALIEQHLQILSRYYLNEDFYQADEDFLQHVMKGKITDLGNEENLPSEKEILEESWACSVRKPNGIYSLERYQVGLIVNSAPVNKFILLCIFINSACMGISASVPEEGNTAKILDWLDMIFLIIFTIESGLQLFFQGFYIYQDLWSSFDVFVVITSWALQGLTVVRGFRALRAMRITLRVGPMKDLLNAFMKSLASLSATICLSLLMMYIFAVLFTQLYKGDGLDYYSSLDRSLFTLLQIMTLDFATPMRQTMKKNPTAWLPHIAFVIIMGLLFFNLMAGVVCDAVQHNDDDSRKEPERISKLSFRLRCISFQVTLLSNTKHNVHEQILVFEKIHEQMKAQRDESLLKEKRKAERKEKRKAERKEKRKAISDHVSTQSSKSSPSELILSK